MAITWVAEQTRPASQVHRHWSLPCCIGGWVRAKRVLMGLVGSTTEFPRATSAQVMVFALLGVLVDNELAPTGVARILALEAGIIGQLVLSCNRLA